MFILHTSNRTELLAEQLASVIDSGPAPSLFAGEPFLIQSRGMERLLTQFLADRFGVWCPAEFFLPLRFLDHLGSLLDKTHDCAAFDRDVLTWRLDQLLRDPKNLRFRPLAVYLSDEQHELKRFQLARELAYRFDQYQIMRPDYIRAWEAGDCVTAHPDERWQQELWTKLREQAGSGSHRGEVIESVIGTLESGSSPAVLTDRRLFVFGIHTLPPLFLEVLNALARHLDVHFFLLSPCREYWGDLKSRRVEMRRETGEADESFTAVRHHPLLTALGRQGGDFQEMLLDQVDACFGSESYADPLDQPVSRLLHRLQADILNDRFDGSPGRNRRIPADDSLMVVSCYSRKRELMVLKDYLLSWFYDETALSLHEVVVMAPDIQDYAALIPAVFADWQYDVSDCHARRDNGYLDGLLQFLHLFTGRYSAPELLGLLERPEISARFSLSAADLDLIRHWIVEAGMRWGLSGEQRHEDGLHRFQGGSWRHGLERLLLGLAVETEEPIDDILPYRDIEGGQVEVLGCLCDFVEAVESGRSLCRTPKTLARWSDALQQCCTLIFPDDDHPAHVEVRRVVARLADEFGPFHRSPVAFEVILAWLESAAEHTTIAGFLSGRLTFCSMLPMRSIPFKVICLLGLNEASYPKHERSVPFDLLSGEYRRGDRSQRGDDRYQFLEAVIAARERLYLSYVGQSSRTNKTIEPSVLITELLETLENEYGIEDPTIRQPLQPFNPAYFTADPPLFSFSEHHCRIARRLARENTVRRPLPWLAAPLDADEVHGVELVELARFLVHPQRYFLRNTMEVEPYSRVLLPPDHEPFELDALGAYQAGEAAVERLLRDEEPCRILETMQHELRWPLGGVGALIWDRELPAYEAFAGKLRAAGCGGARPPVRVRLDVGGRRIGGLLEHQYESGTLLYRWADLRGRDLLVGWLYHLVALQVRPSPAPTIVLARDMCLRFEPLQVDAAALPALLQLYVEGRTIPSPLHVEPAFAYVRQARKNRGRGSKPPLDAARQCYREALDKGYSPESRILFPDMTAEQVLGGAFADFCDTYLVPLWDHACSAAGEDDHD